MQALHHVLDPGVDALMEASRAGGAGPREVAVAAALKLLNCVLDCDEAYVQQLTSLQLHDRCARGPPCPARPWHPSAQSAL